MIHQGLLHGIKKNPFLAPRNRTQVTLPSEIFAKTLITPDLTMVSYVTLVSIRQSVVKAVISPHFPPASEASEKFQLFLLSCACTPSAGREKSGLSFLCFLLSSCKKSYFYVFGLPRIPQRLNVYQDRKLLCCDF